MSIGFKEADRDRIGQIEAADLAPDGDADLSVGMLLDHPVRETLGFGAEEEHFPPFEGVGVERVGEFAPGQDEGMAASGSLDEFCPALPDNEIQIGPVVQAGAADIPVLEAESKGADQMKAGLRGGANATDISGVGGNFRLIEGDLHGSSGLWGREVERKAEGSQRGRAPPPEDMVEWAVRDLNPGLPPCEGGTLTSELTAQKTMVS